MTEKVELLSSTINFAVVRLPDRTFPGVVIQGDTLHLLRKQAQRLQNLLNEGDFEELREELKDLHSLLFEAQRHFETVCAERGIGLPY